MAKPQFPRGAGEPEETSVDPTVLIDRASRRAPTDEIEPTIISPRPDSTRRRAGQASSRTPPASVAGPIASVRPQGKAPGSVGVARPGVRPRGWLPGFGRRSREASGGSSGSGADLRGVMLAIAAVAATALLVFIIVLGWRWIRPPGHRLVITKPDHGSLVAEGIECGSRGDACSVRAAEGQRIELDAEPDDGYVFSALTGDCEKGWVVMSGPRTCGAIFRPIGQPPALLTFTLTIDKPTGGTIQAVGGIECGLMGSSCTTQLANGTPVQLFPRPDTGHEFRNYTGECSADGRTTMTAARQCGGVFEPKGQQPSARPLGPVGPSPRRNQAPDIIPPLSLPTPPAGGASPASPSGGNQPPATPASSGTPGGTVVVPAPEKPVKAPPTAEEHAKEEINQLPKKYCAALMTLNPAEVRKLHPQANLVNLKNGFKELRSLKCSAGPVEYVALHPSEPGSATIKFDMKQTRVWRSNGASPIEETIVTMRLARENFSSPWLIDYLRHDVKER